MRAEMMVNVSGGMGFSMPRNVDLSTTSFEDESDRTAIVYFSNLVNESLGAIKTNSMRLCLSLYKCKEHFRKSGEAGWTSFVEANFVPQGLTLLDVRRSIAAGRSMANILDHHDLESRSNINEMFETMSMRAIRTLSMTEGDEQVEIVAKLVDQYDGTKKAPTAADIEELREELAQARDRVRGQDTALMQMTSQLAANDAAVSELREKNQLLESANERLKNVATREPVTVETVQPDAERSMRELRKLQKQIEEASASLAAINSQLISNEEQLANLRSRKESEQTIDDLRTTIEHLRRIWTPSRVQAIKTESGNLEAFKTIAFDIRELAALFESN
jgi:hypothetical protein